ncbi:MAG TPA: exodeoxyribonuclease V subunit gamma, partial [Rubrivivax sp.]|nr:exodeoxyribonuclease V subunit gamma [Rubrivivax sp.]
DSDTDGRADEGPASPRPSFAAPLSAPAPAARQLTLAQLIAFFRNPCRALLRQRLGIELAREADELSDDESFVADRRIRRALWRRLLPRLLATAAAACAVEDDELRTLARADGVWPDGALGEAGLRHELHLLRGFAARLRTLASEPTLPSVTLTLPLTLQGEPWQLQAGFADLRASGLLRWGDDAPRAVDRLEAWLQHLALCAAAPPGVARRTRWLWPQGEFEFTACDDAPAQLGALLALVRQGLAEPLHFYARSAWLCVDKGLAAARGAWHGASAQGVPGEGDDAAYRLALRGVAEPLDAQFEQLAQQVYAPLRRHLREAEA